MSGDRIFLARRGRGRGSRALAVLATLALGGLVPVALVLGAGCSPRAAQVQESPAPPAPGWTAKDLEGRPQSLADLRGKVVLIDFWATWCAPCRAEIPEYIALQAKHGADGLVVLGMSLDTLPTEAVRDFVRKAGINYPVIVTDSEIAEAYNVQVLPTTVLIDREGRVRHRKEGAMRDAEAYAGQVRALLAERAR